MLKLTVAVLAIALAGSASAAKWKELRVDASSEAAFEQSLVAFKEKLSPARRYVFGEALKDIWVKGTQAAEAEQREYTAADYYRQVHGLGYEELIAFADPSGDTARARYRSASYQPASLRPNLRPVSSPWRTSQTRPFGGWGTIGDGAVQGN